MLPLNVPLADYPLNNDTVSPGFLGFGVFLALAAATYLLIRSMNKQMRKIQAPHEADLKQQEWEAAQTRRSAPAGKAAATGKTSSADKPDGA
ncbi:hypothetical protein GCM10009678_60790 [Actinomadura kijaniata]|uniref:Uncharacterized protein n=1 Tax=Actinomadura namibiensis TaxID=182080 RepID=A0A7W3LHW3_ACTNM|nr:hypothetical protein [Actinomadura namibiensis]MBA8948457.1 hypothetical protein [Actinomadura namibiensis]